MCFSGLLFLVAGCAVFEPASDLHTFDPAKTASEAGPEVVDTSPAEMDRRRAGEGPASGPPRQAAGHVSAAFSNSAGLNYLLTLPNRDDAGAAAPLIVFLHSLEERGDRLSPAFENPAGQGIGLAAFAAEQDDFPFVTLSPLCPANTYWFNIHERLARLVEEIVVEYQIDPSRVYLTGVSMGGMGAWSFAMAYPEVFSAVAPLAGGVYSPPMPADYDRLVHLPFWAFHARGDESIPLDVAERSVAGLRAAGGSAQLQVIESDEHYIHEEVFADGAVFEWFLRHSREE